MWQPQPLAPLGPMDMLLASAYGPGLQQDPVAGLGQQQNHRASRQGMTISHYPCVFCNVTFKMSYDVCLKKRVSLPAVPMLRMEISPKYDPALRVARIVFPSSATTSKRPRAQMYISFPTSPGKNSNTMSEITKMIGLNQPHGHVHQGIARFVTNKGKGRRLAHAINKPLFMALFCKHHCFIQTLWVFTLNFIFTGFWPPVLADYLAEFSKQKVHNIVVQMKHSEHSPFLQMQSPGEKRTGLSLRTNSHKKPASVF